jgi:hypothetical protein
MSLSTPDRVALRIEKFTEQQGECLVSLYSIGSHGYAQIGWNEDGKSVVTVAHRALWISRRGPVPEGHVVDHICHNKRCVRLDHLRLLTNYENARRTNGRDWPLGECVNGHPNSELVTASSGKRICRPCRNEWQRRYRAKQKGLGHGDDQRR